MQHPLYLFMQHERRSLADGVDVMQAQTKQHIAADLAAVTSSVFRCLVRSSTICLYIQLTNALRCFLAKPMSINTLRRCTGGWSALCYSVVRVPLSHPA